MKEMTLEIWATSVMKVKIETHFIVCDDKGSNLWLVQTCPN